MDESGASGEVLGLLTALESLANFTPRGKRRIAYAITLLP